LAGVKGCFTSFTIGKQTNKPERERPNAMMCERDADGVTQKRDVASTVIPREVRKDACRYDTAGVLGATTGEQRTKMMSSTGAETAAS
jgi:hypothetical protein